MASQPKTTKKSGVHTLRMRVQAYEPRVLDSSVKQIIETASRLETSVVGPIPLPTKIKKHSVNRASFVAKTSQEQFEMRTHMRLLDIEQPSPQVIEALSNLSLPAGVSIEAQMLS
ncbi:MAG: 30S ribosomal protein S10 [Candidatus Kaiserbacteria bacterium]|nr:30S ribosomal protein S10 [Candidatus Kaiserbacteria bacterium]